jgi:hypothetical protein
MSEFDSESGTKGFVRDVMRRISSTGLHGADERASERERRGDRMSDRTNERKGDSRMGPFQFMVELLRWVERQLDKVSRELGPKPGGCARLLVVCLLLTNAGETCGSRIERFPELLRGGWDRIEGLAPAAEAPEAEVASDTASLCEAFQKDTASPEAAMPRGCGVGPREPSSATS